MAVITGDGSNNDLVGSGDADSLSGQGGSDTLSGLGGADTLRGDDGADVLIGGAGNDLLDGGTGADVVLYYRDGGPSGVSVNLGTGLATDSFGSTDTLISIEQVHGSNLADTLTGGAADDQLVGWNGSDLIRGMGGNDMLVGGEGSDTLDGGTGNDVVLYYRDGGPSGVSVNLGTGLATDSFGTTDTLISIEQVHGSNLADTLTGGAADDLLIGWSGSDLIRGMGGNDMLVGGEGNDTLDGGTGNDQVAYFQEVDALGHAGTRGVSVNLGTGLATDSFGHSDVLQSVERLFGTALADTLTGSDPAGELLSGEAGDDLIAGGGGEDSLIGGAGRDTLTGGEGSDRLMYALEGGTLGVRVDLALGTATDSYGDADVIAGFEHVFGTRFNDTLTGSAAPDERFFGGAGDDVIDGNDGNNLIYTGTGNDTIHVGTTLVDSRDTVVIDGAGSKVILGDPAEGTRYGHHIDFDLFEAVTVNLATGLATSASMTLDFSGALHFLEVAATGLNDVLIGGNPTHDYLEWFTGNAGDDTIDGGSGTGDTVVYDREVLIGAPDPLTGQRGYGFQGVVVNLAEGWAIDSYGDRDTLISIDQVHGTLFADSITGDALDNGFWALEGNDTVIGGAGIDRIHYTEDSAAGGMAGVLVDLVSGIATDGFGDTDLLIGIEHVHATNFADYMQGDGQDNWLFGYDANDTLLGGGGLDILDGGQGNDLLSGEDGDDELWGQAGNDTLNGAAGQDAVRYLDDAAGVLVNLATGTARDGSGGTDTLISIERAHGSAHADTILGDGQANQLLGYAGNDSLRGGDGNDTILGGAGADTLLAEAGDDEIWGGAGNDTINGGAGFDIVRYRDALAGVVVDLAAGTAADGAGGTDGLIEIEGAHGSDLADTLSGSAGGNQLAGYAGNDSILGLAGADTLLGGAGQDTIYGGDGGDELWGEQGNDLLDGGAGFDIARYLDAAAGISADLSIGRVQDGHGTLDALAGIEGIYGSAHADTMTGAATADTFSGFGGDDLLNGAAGDDTLLGGEGNDSLSGAAGLDEIWGGAGNDTLDGGEGLDLVRYRDALAAVSASLATGLAQDGMGGTDLLRNVENLDGSVFGDSLAGDAFGNRLFGFEGDDTLSGAAGNDTLVGGTEADSLLGGAGDDELWGEAGDDSIDGGDGADLVRYRTVGGSVRADLAAGSASDGQGGTDALVNVEHVDGSDHADVLSGNAAGNRLFGYLGADVLSGRAGNDTLLGGAGDDSILGGEGDDEIWGEAGNDTLDGGAGVDVARYRSATAGVTVLLAAGTAEDGMGGTDLLRGIEHVHGSDQDDALIGDAAGNALFGYAGDDTMDGGTGADTLSGGLGGDTYVYFAGGGRDVVNDLGGSGGAADVLVIADYSAAHASVRQQGTAIVLDFGATSDSVTIANATDPAGPGAIESVAFADGTVWDLATLLAMVGQVGQPAINTPATPGADVLFGTIGGNALDGLEGDDVLHGLAGNDTLTGGAGNDTILSGDGDDLVFGGAGDDLVFLGTGQDTVEGGADFDIAVFDIAFAALGGDFSADEAGVATIGGNVLSGIELFRFAGRDIPIGEFLILAANAAPVSTLPAVLQSTEGVISIDLAAWFSDADGDALTYQVTDLPAGITLTGSVLSGSIAATGVPHAIGIVVSDGTHELRQTLDWQILNVNAAPTGGLTVTGSAMVGHALTVTSSVADADGIDPATQSYVWLRNGTAIPGATGAAYLLTDADYGARISVQLRYTDLFGTAEAVTSPQTAAVQAEPLFLTGDTGPDVLRGGFADDSIFGLAGNDHLDGRDGNDSLYGGDGTDTLNGGTGADVLVGGESAADLRDILYGGDGNDSMDGGYGNDEMNGGNHNDTLLGGIGADTLIGNADNDLLAGMGGSDLLYGNAGADTLNGGFGYDRLNGGTGADSFFHQGVADHGSDWVQDYVAADGDVLTVGLAGATASQFQVNYANTAGAGSSAVAEAFIIYKPTGQILWALIDGAAQTSINVQIGGQVYDLLA